MGGFNFSTESKILRWLVRGDTIYDVELPEDAEVVDCPSNSAPHGVFRSNKIIISNPRTVTDDIAMKLYLKSDLPEKSYYKAMAGCAVRGYMNTALKIFEDKVNKENVRLVTLEFEDFCKQGTEKQFDENKHLNEQTRFIYNKLKKLARNHERAFLNFGSASDPYMEIEKELELTREILKIFLRFKYPVHIITKSDLILRDTDILKKLNDAAILPDDLKGLKSKVCVTFSFSTVDDDLASLVEPNAPLPSQRLKAMSTLANEGFHVGVALMPILPYINDDLESLENFVKVFRKNNAAYLIPGALSLFGSSEISSRIKYYNFVKSNFPEILDDVKTLFYNREYPSNKYQNNLYRKVVRICKKQGIKTAMI